jgi:hypothetical protein
LADWRIHCAHGAGGRFDRTSGVAEIFANFSF